MTRPNPGNIDILQFWGKARPREAAGPRWHPAAFHCLDVAAVGEALFAKHRGLGESLCRLLGLPHELAAPLICYLLSLHDVGKFARKFQAKEPARYPDCFRDDPAGFAHHYDHGAGCLSLFDVDPAAFRLPKGVRHSVWRPLISAVAGHHGAPPPTRGDESRTTLRREFGRVGIEAAHEFIRQASALFSPVPDLSGADRASWRRASHAIAGLAVLADWIGSSQDWFPYSEPERDLAAYWRVTRERAERAVAEAGVLPAAASPGLAWSDLIGADAAPSPMQAWAGNAELADGPALFLIEDETGSGKTEAALMLAHRLMRAGRADGVYVALPTMATANAMFDRLAAAHRRLFDADAEPSIALAHGARGLHEGFRAAVVRGGRFEDPYSRGPGSDDDSETTASAACAAWIADDRRRAFLAHVGAGTIDQALLSVLPSRHQSLRLLGLLRRVLILDEVHAYDAYMQREMERLLEFQAALGGSAILLSATLPRSIRERLADAFTKGLGRATDGGAENMDYPLATVCAAHECSTTAVPGQAGRGRALPVRFLRSPDTALDEVERAAGAGKAVLYIRNTVDDAFEAYAALEARGLDAGLFHSRFALVDRLEIEKNVAATFGKRSTSDARAGKVLIATQVVEQSLDLDFDVLVTDLAPIDLLIQRAGRLWRHERKEREGRPELLVVGPQPIDEAGGDWFSRSFPRAAYVYKDHARLWLTARTLQDAGAIESPGGLRTLVESVYGEAIEERIPVALLDSLFAAEGRAGADRGAATTNLLSPGKGYVRDAGAWDSDARTPTRIEEVPRVTLRLARHRAGRVVPYAHDESPDEPWRAWRLSEVDAPQRRVGGEAVPPGLAAAARAAKADWSRYDSAKVLTVLGESETGAALRGRALSGGESPRDVVLMYDSRQGLTWKRNEE